MSVQDEVIKENNALRKENEKLRGKIEAMKRECHGAKHYANNMQVWLEEARRLAEEWRAKAYKLSGDERIFPFDSLPWKEEK